MTRERAFGTDTAFCGWMRACKELPSYSRDVGFVATDTDVCVHRYLHSVDGLGSREVQGLMQIEVKSRGAMPRESQLDTLSKLNLFAGHRELKSQHVRFFGVFILVMSDTTPDDSTWMKWGIIPKKLAVKCYSDLIWKFVTRDELIALLKFELHPRNFTKRVFRRHHKKLEIVVVEQSPLGFPVERRIVKRS